MNLRHELAWRERHDFVTSGVESVVMWVRENQAVFFDVPAPSPGVLWPVIELPHAPTAIGVKDDDPRRSDLAAEYPGADHRLRVILRRRRRNVTAGEQCNTECDDERLHTPNEIWMEFFRLIRLLALGESDKSGVMGELRRIIRHLGSGMIRV
jgi:hypothetical protein